MLKGSLVGLAVAAGFALLTGSSVAQNLEAIKLRVPVQLKQMLVEKVRVDCVILRESTNEALTNGHQKSEWHDIVNGEFDQVIEISMTAKAGKQFAGADTYNCRLELTGGPYSFPFGFTNPTKGTPSGGNDPNIHRLGKPDQFFRAIATGRIDGGGKSVDGIVGPSKDLTIGPKPKQ